MQLDGTADNGSETSASDQPAPVEDTATRSVESTSHPSTAATPSHPRNSKNNKRILTSELLPKSLTPKMQNAIRIFSTGISAPESCKRTGVGIRYFHRVMKAPIGRDYFATITKKIEDTFLDKAAAVAASDAKISIAVSTVQNEIDEAVLESVQELRSIVKTSKSDAARALAAKELLDLAQAKKRYMAAKGSSESDIVLTADDIASFGLACADLRSLHMTSTKDIKDAPGEDLHPEDASIIRTIEAAVDPETLAAAVAAIDQPSVADADAVVAFEATAAVDIVESAA